MVFNKQIIENKLNFLQIFFEQKKILCVNLVIIIIIIIKIIIKKY